MHVLQQKHLRLKSEETNELLKEFNISLTQLPKIKSTDPALPKDCNFGDIVKIERKDLFDAGKKSVYHRVVV